MACLQFHNGETLHHFTGYGDGHLPVTDIIAKLQSNLYYKPVKDNIRKCEVLIIDEIGLISAKMFEAVELICRTVRDSEEVFSGIQIIGAGSFVQLPPVPSKLDEAKYAFQAEIFRHVFPHKLLLKQVVRQSEKEFTQAINELCEGGVSQQSIDLMKFLSRPLSPNADPVYIFGTNLDIDVFNYDKLGAIPGPAKIYHAVDDGDRKYLRRCAAPKHLALKLKCKVLVTRNLTDGLVNGMTGIVMELHDDKIVVQINDDKFLGHAFGGKVFNICKYTFPLRDAANKVVAVRKQFPVRLGYALTVDKAQGRSIEELVIDAYWRPGQFGVAMGRAMRTQGLQVQNFNSAACALKHPQIVYDYYAEKSKTLKGDLTCCKIRICDLQLQKMVHVDELMMEDHMDNAEGQSDACGPPLCSHKKQYPYDVSVLLEKVKIYVPGEDTHMERNNFVDSLITSEKATVFIH